MIRFTSPTESRESVRSRSSQTPNNPAFLAAMASSSRLSLLNLARQARTCPVQSNAVGVRITTLVGASLLEQILT
ncbi:hypothetical protein [Nostoc sp. 2RC]|uniref:hypothetical protein n=1 Tax=Nostoc sp. 2RC TaxID=2485484 RepID=UPI00162671F0|nr:hypothetical protein [Nostoc sp. 2RC]MBC1239520.1 hypothetical protein [Nostoc sp. 2RC]